MINFLLLLLTHLLKIYSAYLAYNPFVASTCSSEKSNNLLLSKNLCEDFQEMNEEEGAR